MKGRVLVIDTPKDRPSAAALVVDGTLEDLIFDPPTGSGLPSTGDIAVAKVTRVLGGKGGAFCTMRGGQGFLRDAQGLSSGDRLLVQVASLPEPGKAITVTQRVLYKGPRLILTPGAPGVNVSRQIRDGDERERLEAGGQAALEAEGAADFGLIMRSAAEGEEGLYLQRELAGLVAAERAASAALASGEDPAPSGTALDVARRDWLFPLPDQIIVPKDLEARLSGTDEDPAAGLWGDVRTLERLVVERDPFEAAGIWDAIAAAQAPDVPLSDGSMVIEATRALVAVDVNTGGDFSPAAGLKANIAAMRALPRHLRLRGLGGQIVVDFAPMPKKERKGFEGAVKAAFRRDPIETSLIGWTGMGLYELQRKRERWPLSTTFPSTR